MASMRRTDFSSPKRSICDPNARRLNPAEEELQRTCALMPTDPRPPRWKRWSSGSHRYRHGPPSGDPPPGKRGDHGRTQREVRQKSASPHAVVPSTMGSRASAPPTMATHETKFRRRFLHHGAGLVTPAIPSATAPPQHLGNKRQLESRNAQSSLKSVRQQIDRWSPRSGSPVHRLQTDQNDALGPYHGRKQLQKPNGWLKVGLQHHALRARLPGDLATAQGEMNRGPPWTTTSRCRTWPGNKTTTLERYNLRVRIASR